MEWHAGLLTSKPVLEERLLPVDASTSTSTEQQVYEHQVQPAGMHTQHEFDQDFDGSEGDEIDMYGLDLDDFGDAGEDYDDDFDY